MAASRQTFIPAFVLAAMLTVFGADGAAAKQWSPVASLYEKRTEHVVLQQTDLSCGAAALATILRYQHGETVSERDVALGLIARKQYLEQPDLVRIRQGFSLLDLKRYTDSLGYAGTAYGGLEFDDLVEHAPAIVAIRLFGYNHFVVFRGIVRNRVLLADPAYGNRTLSVKRFTRAWTDYAGIGRVGFVVKRKDGLIPPDRLAPRPAEFTTFGGGA